MPGRPRPNKTVRSLIPFESSRPMSSIKPDRSLSPFEPGRSMSSFKPGRSLSLFDIVISLLHTFGIEFWIVALGPFYIGWSIALGLIFPMEDTILAMVVLGPCIAGFTFLFNDHCDWTNDIGNWRKDTGLIHSGLLSPERALRLSLALAAIGMLISLWLSLTFAILMGLALALSALYSHPITKLKAKPGIDLLVNMVGIGILCPLAGWEIGGGDILQFPLHYLFAIALIIGGLYGPTTVVDWKSDKQAGYQTLAVRLGPRNALKLSQLLLTLGVASLIVQGMNDYVIPRGVLQVTYPTLLATPLIYLVAFHKPTEIRVLAGLFFTSVMFAFGCVMFLFYNSGIWTI